MRSRLHSSLLYCAEHTAYHHGEASLHSTIVGMAQNFVGSNNINLVSMIICFQKTQSAQCKKNLTIVFVQLIPSGQFGTRLMGGSDAASPRYIYTLLSPIARLLFPEVDDMVSAFLFLQHLRNIISIIQSIIPFSF